MQHITTGIRVFHALIVDKSHHAVSQRSERTPRRFSCRLMALALLVLPHTVVAAAAPETKSRLLLKRS